MVNTRAIKEMERKAVEISVSTAEAACRAVAIPFIVPTEIRMENESSGSAYNFNLAGLYALVCSVAEPITLGLVGAVYLTTLREELKYYPLIAGTLVVTNALSGLYEWYRHEANRDRTSAPNANSSTTLASPLEARALTPIVPVSPIVQNPQETPRQGEVKPSNLEVEAETQPKPASIFSGNGVIPLEPDYRDKKV